MSTKRDSHIDNIRSSHPVMTSTMNGFYKQFMQNEKMTHAKHRFGQLPQRPSRNPILYENTPRLSVLYDPSIPEAPKIKERWHYPEQDWGIAAAFPTQKKLYETQYAKQQDFEMRLSQARFFNSTENENVTLKNEADTSKLDSFEKTFDSILVKGDANSPNRENNDEVTVGTTADSDTYSSRNFQPSSYRTDDYSTNSARWQRTDGVMSKIKGGGGSGNHSVTFRKLGDLNDLPISTFKSLDSEHPEVLAKWREGKAARYLEKSRLEVPRSTIAASRAFLPNGGPTPASTLVGFDDATVANKKNKQDKVRGKSEKKEAGDELTKLINALEETELEISKLNRKKIGRNKL